MFKGGIEAADFHAYKFKTKKNQAHNDWYNEVMESVKALNTYVKEHYPTGLTFNANGSDDWSNVSSGKASGPVKTQDKPTPEVKQGMDFDIVEKPKEQQKKGPSKSQIGINWNIAHYDSG